jgi:putative ABC transport system permease protein
MRFKIALRNTFRNKRRTAINVLMIAGGVSAIVVYQGFALNMIYSLRETTIKSQTGHLQIATPIYWNKSALSPKQALIPQAAQVISAVYRNKHVRYATGRISFYGLLSAGEQSLSMQGVTFDPSVEGSLVKHFRLIGGRGFTQPGAFEIVLGSGLATRARVKVRDRVTVLAQTYDGVVNALDVEVVGILQTGVSEFDENTLLIPLRLAQKLLDTNKVEQIVVGLDSTDNTAAVQAELQGRLGPGLVVRPWSAIARLYNQIVAFNGVQMHIVEGIILSLILLGILNTIGMSIFERTGEIGTIAALGETRRTIRLQFVLEGVILGALGALCGIALGAVEIQAINAMDIQVVMPGASTSFPVRLLLYFAAFRDAAILALMAAGIAALVPALRASRMNIAEALRRNL